MTATPQPHRAKDGTITYSVRFRLAARANPVKETFGPIPSDRDGSRALAEAVKFAKVVDRIGGDAARARRRRGEGSARTVPTVRTALDVHLGRLTALTPGTLAEYRRLAERSWLPALGAMPVDVLTDDDVSDWIGAQRKVETARSVSIRAAALRRRAKDPAVIVPPVATWSGKSIKNAHALLSDTLATMVAKGVIAANVARGIALPHDDVHAAMTILTDNEFVLLHAATPGHYQLFVAMLYATGARFGEVTAMRGDQFDLDGDVPLVHISRAWKKAERGVYLGSPKTEKGRRRVSLPDQVVQPLRDLIAATPPGGLLFTTRQGGRIQSQHFGERVWRPSIVRSGIGKRPRIHDLRHTHASQMLARGMSLKELQDRLGHESMKTTADTYGHLLPGALAAGARFATLALAGAMPDVEPLQIER